ncbi:hypothetical protein GCM10009642_45540 [Nocardiopsis metallicus]
MAGRRAGVAGLLRGRAVLLRRLVLERRLGQARLLGLGLLGLGLLGLPRVLGAPRLLGVLLGLARRLLRKLVLLPLVAGMTGWGRREGLSHTRGSVQE